MNSGLFSGGYKSLKDYHYSVAQGNIDNASTWNKWGYNGDISSASAETVWSPGGSFSPMSTAGVLSLASSSANDTSAGTGAQSIIIYGVDQDYLEQTEVVTLNGTSTVTTSKQWLGINRMAVYLAGSNGFNVGTITATGDSTTQAAIPAQEGSTQHAFFFVQASHSALMDWLIINAIKTSGGGNPEITTKCIVTSLVSGAKYDVFTDYMDTQRENFHQYTPSQPFVVGEKSLIEFVSETDTNNTAVSIRFSFIEVPNS